jgi:HTH-type transcriptional regulator / antitoxin HigA
VIKVIKTESDYAAAIKEIERLIDLDPQAGTPEADRLEVLGLLAHEYESHRFPVRVPTPVDAIRFRMDQQGLKHRDLVPFIGSRSKVSEVLSGKRPLSLSMIRALSAGLGIPTEVLLAEPVTRGRPADAEDWRQYPIKEMVRRGWVGAEDMREDPSEALTAFLRPCATAGLSIRYRQSWTVRSTRRMDLFALEAWTARVLRLAELQRDVADSEEPAVTSGLLTEVAKLSWSEVGPRLAAEFLRKSGITFVIEPHLPRTYLDGGALLTSDGRRVVALTLRHDRLDSFWFTLMHELAHLALHVTGEQRAFLDDLDAEHVDNPIEMEADAFAGAALIPPGAWQRSPASRLRSPEAAGHLARELRIHPAIVAGRIRREFRSYRVLSNLVGYGQVRRLFPEVNWQHESSEKR